MYGKRVFKEVSNFNPRSREGSDKILSFYRLAFDDFNPRSREGSDTERSSTPFVSVISIHAPAKGATFCLFNHCKFLSISIHAPAKGATLVCAIVTCFALFQSTLPRRERHSQDNNPLRPEEISIHAPAKGATLFAQAAEWQKIFQSTLPRRERQYL